MIHNERIKLLATGLNNLAVATAVAGVIAPAANGVLWGTTKLLIAVSWTCFGSSLHLSAHLVLGRLKA